MVQISPDDARFMRHVLDLNERLRKVLDEATERGGEVTDDDADQLRDLCGERLQTHGFDDDYKPTEEGQQLERLIDKLFIG